MKIHNSLIVKYLRERHKKSPENGASYCKISTFAENTNLYS